MKRTLNKMKDAVDICKKESRFYWNRLWILLFGIGFAIFFCVMPKYHNDYMFMRGLDQWFRQNGVVNPDDGVNIFRSGIPWDTIRETLLTQYNCDNLRMSNVIATFLLLLPKWFGSGLMTILWVWSAVLGMKLVDVDVDRSPLVVLCLVGWTFLLPWSNHFGCLDFQLNYILPTFLSMLLLSLLKRRRDRKEPLLFAAVTLLSLFLGAAHEGFSASLIVGIAIVVLVCRGWRTPAVLLSLAGLIVGCAFLLNVPGAKLRSEAQINLSRILDVELVKFLFEQYCRPFGICLLLLFALLVPAVRKRFRSDGNTIILLLVSATSVSMVIAMATLTAARGWFWFEFLSVLLLADILGKYGYRYFMRYRTSTVLTAIPLLVLMYLHLLFVDVAAFRYRPVMTAAVDDVRRKGESFVFCSDESMQRLPLVCGMRPDLDFEKYAMVDIANYLGFDWEADKTKNVYPVIIPATLRSVDLETGKPLDEHDNIRIAGREIFMPYDEFRKFTPYRGMNTIIYLDYGNGYCRASAFVATFRSERDGKLYVWIKPNIPWYLDRLKTLQKARLGQAEWFEN